jgi:hypothetical protein
MERGFRESGGYPPLFVLSLAYRRTKAQSESRMNLAEVQPKFSNRNRRR